MTTKQRQQMAEQAEKLMQQALEIMRTVKSDCTNDFLGSGEPTTIDNLLEPESMGKQTLRVEMEYIERVYDLASRGEALVSAYAHKDYFDQVD